MNRLVGRSLALLLLILPVAGCGGRDDLIRITGKVTYKGQPVQGVAVTFNPDDGRRASVGQTNAEGIYRLYHTADAMGALPGEHTIKLEIPPDVNAVAAKPGSEADIEGGFQWPTTVIIDQGTTTIDFDLGQLPQK